MERRPMKESPPQREQQKSNFQWNPYADQPHNVFPRKERVRQHVRDAGTYVSLCLSNLRKLAPGLALYRKYRKQMYRAPLTFNAPFALSVSPENGKEENLLELLKEVGVRRSLVRIPSWERHKLDDLEKFFDFLTENGMEITVALLQQRADVLDPGRWESFLEEVFSRFRNYSSYFEIAHAWNRTKWGVWGFPEYLKLARPAVSLAGKYGVHLVGPAVLDFEFHLYPPVLKEVSFEKVSSLLYVDRMGAPENKQFGWDLSRKIALLKATVDVCSQKGRDVWITEFNWPLKGTGKYSPAAGKPNVTEEQQADYLVRYCVPAVASGLIERVYWWQMVAPGYGLIDSRGETWRKRPGFHAMKQMVSRLEGSRFVGKLHHPRAEIFSFSREKENFAVCWTRELSSGATGDLIFPARVIRILNRDGQEIPCNNNRVRFGESPKYVYFE